MKDIKIPITCVKCNEETDKWEMEGDISIDKALDTFKKCTGFNGADSLISNPFLLSLTIVISLAFALVN